MPGCVTQSEFSKVSNQLLELPLVHLSALSNTKRRRPCEGRVFVGKVACFLDVIDH